MLIVQHLNWSVAVPGATVCLRCVTLWPVAVISHTGLQRPPEIGISNVETGSNARCRLSRLAV